MFEKQGYLKEDFKIFSIKDYCSKTFDFHYHDFYKIIVFEGGNVTINIEGKNYDLKKGDIVLVPMNELHKPVVDPKVCYERIVLYLSQSFLSQDKSLLDCFAKARESHTNVMRLSALDYSKLLELLNNALKKEKEEYGGRLYSKLLVTEAVLLINESVNKNGLLFDGNVSYDKKIVEVCEYINSHLKDDLSVDSLSERFFISKYYFMRKFKEYTGVTLHNYILEKRILFAKSLNESGIKITYACIEAGFKDYSTYLRAKKRHSERYLGLDNKE